MKIDQKYCCYEEMSQGVGGQSIPSECHDESMRNAYENGRKEGNNWNWSGMKGGKE